MRTSVGITSGARMIRNSPARPGGLRRVSANAAGIASRSVPTTVNVATYAELSNAWPRLARFHASARLPIAGGTGTESGPAYRSAVVLTAFVSVQMTG